MTNSKKKVSRGTPKKNPTRKRGQPTRYNKTTAEQARQLCLLGATDEQLAKFFKVTRRTIDNWKKAHPEFFRTLKNAKHEKDTKVERSLLERAMGYSHPESKFMIVDGELQEIETIKHYPPDPVSMIFWLKNRKPAQWRDKQEIVTDGSLTVIVKNFADKDKK